MSGPPYYGSMDANGGAHCAGASDDDDVALELALALAMQQAAPRPRAGTCCGSRMLACHGNDRFICVSVFSFIVAFFFFGIGLWLSIVSDDETYYLNKACITKCIDLCYDKEQCRCDNSVYKACMDVCNQPPNSMSRMGAAGVALLVIAMFICALDAAACFCTSAGSCRPEHT